MTPFKTNQQMDIERKEKEEKQNAMDNYASIKRQFQTMQSGQPGQIGQASQIYSSGVDPLLELKINQPQQMMPNTGMAPMNQVYPASYVPVPNPYYPTATNAMIPWQFTPNNVPIVKKYNISLGNGNGDITKLASLHEDILPSEGNVSNNTFNTLKERLIIHHYIRSIFIKTGDGEELLINGGENNSGSELVNLLSHVKLLEINPYHFNRITDNPYKTLPNNFVMYRSCYPIKLGNLNVVECSKSSIGMNVRIYLLSKYDEDINNTRGLPRYNSDIWRELDYYQYIREEIIKPNLSPNFISLHAYYMTKNTGINFKKFENIRGKLQVRNFNIEKSNASVRNNMYISYIKEYYYNNPKETVTIDDLINANLLPKGTPFRSVSEAERKQMIDIRVDRLIANNKLGHNLDSDKCLVMLSEAPTQHIFNWATRTYKVDNGPVRSMVNNGFHSDKVWESVYFQLLLSMLIMMEKKIMFTEFSLKNNVYIKDLRHNNQNIGVWKYIYNGIEYFVPNYGYLTLIDSNFAEIDSNPHPFDRSYNPSGITFRIKSTLLNDTNVNGEIYKLCLDRMIDVFSSNNLGREFTNYGGIAPTRAFLSDIDALRAMLEMIRNRYFGVGVAYTLASERALLNDMKELPSRLIGQNIFNMVHSRIGTPVKDQEKSYVADRFDFANTKVGSIVVRKISATFSTYAIYLGPETPVAPATVPTYAILTTDEPIFSFDERATKRLVKHSVDLSVLSNYYGQPEHAYEPGKQTNVLETYLISLAQN